MGYQRRSAKDSACLKRALRMSTSA
jgi:hypothetical protein